MAYSGRIKLVIWDWNGTLQDDAGASHESVNDMLLRRGLPLISFEQYSSYIETPIIGFYRHIFDVDSMDFSEISREFHEGFERHMEKYGLMEGALESIERLRAAGISQVIVSSSHRDQLMRFADRYGVTDRFDAILAADDFHAASKIERARDYLSEKGISPAQTVVIGDQLHDAEMAQEIGAHCILQCKGHQIRSHLEPVGQPIADGLIQAVDMILSDIFNSERK